MGALLNINHLPPCNKWQAILNLLHWNCYRRPLPAGNGLQYFRCWVTCCKKTKQRSKSWDQHSPFHLLHLPISTMICTFLQHKENNTPPQPHLLSSAIRFRNPSSVTNVISQCNWKKSQMQFIFPYLLLALHSAWREKKNPLEWTVLFSGSNKLTGFEGLAGFGEQPTASLFGQAL